MPPHSFASGPKRGSFLKALYRFSYINQASTPSGKETVSDGLLGSAHNPLREINLATRSHGELLLAFVPLLAMVLVQIYNGAQLLSSDLATPDEPAQFTSGVLVHDYAFSGFRLAPLPYARAFYEQYPKVAIGHWPPAFHILEAAWMSIFPITVESLRIFCALIAGTLTMLIFRIVRQNHGVPLALLAASCFLGAPIIQHHAWLVMSDVAVSLFIFLAVLAFQRFMDKPEGPHVFWFILWSVAAISTKGSAWALGPFAILAPLFAGYWRMLLRWRYLLSGVAIVLLSAPFYLFTWKAHIGYAENPVKFATSHTTLVERIFQVTNMFSFAPVPYLILAAFGAIIAWKTCRMAIAWFSAQALFFLLFPMTGDERYFLPALSLLILPITECLRAIALWFSFPIAVAVVGLLHLHSGVQTPSTASGFRELVASIPSGKKVLIVSDSSGEGAVVVYRLVSDIDRRETVLRGSKFLAQSSWNGNDYQPRFSDPGQISQALYDAQVDYVIIDLASAETPHSKLLQQALQHSQSGYKMTAQFLIKPSYRPIDKAIVFRRTS